MTLLFKIFKRFRFQAFSRKKVDREIRKNWADMTSPVSYRRRRLMLRSRR
jgi:hypothetical protein